MVSIIHLDYINYTDFSEEERLLLILTSRENDQNIYVYISYFILLTFLTRPDWTRPDQSQPDQTGPGWTQELLALLY